MAFSWTFVRSYGSFSWWLCCYFGIQLRTLHIKLFIGMYCTMKHVFILMVISSWYNSPRSHDSFLMLYIHVIHHHKSHISSKQDKYAKQHWLALHEDVIKWKPSLVTGLWRGALMFSLISAWTNGWVNNRNAGGLRRYRAHYDVIVMWYWCLPCDEIA